MTLIFATNNQHKVEEIRSTTSEFLNIITIKEAGIIIDIPEPYDTLEENATNKSRTIFAMTGFNCFSEDSGLEVAALNGEPGVKSSIYAGQNRSDEKNIEKLLQKLEGKADRNARFITIISLIIEGKESRFEGVCSGTITLERKGNHGFGYDPVFIPDGSTRTFAEMSLGEKDRFSHRAKATEKLVAFLSQLTAMDISLAQKPDN